MTPGPQFPKKPQATATDAELRAYLCDLLDRASNQGVAALRRQGFTDQDMFELRRLATVYRSGKDTPQDLQSLWMVADKLC